MTRYVYKEVDRTIEYAVSLTICALVIISVLIKYWAAGGKCEHRPRLTGKIIVVTGANTGIGCITVKELAKLGAEKVILACRSETKGEQAIETIKKEYKVKNLEFMQLDLNDLDSVKTFANNFKAKYNRLDVLINNAGIMALPTRQSTEQGFEKQIGVNHLGHFLLTQLLFEQIQAAQEGRIVNVSSEAHRMCKSINLEDLGWETRKYTDWSAYASSKMANVYFTKQLNNKLEKDNI